VAAKAVVPGFNFAFGYKREGTVVALTSMCRESGIICVPVPPFTVDGEAVSSSRIRRELLAGNVAQAAKLLGRPHRATGTVTVGQRRGMSLGFPTANLAGVQTLLPRDGVYRVLVHYQDKILQGAANIGPNPTFGEIAPKFEVHLLDFSGDLYGDTLAIDFMQRLRETRKFNAVAQLIEQLHADIAAIRRIEDDGGC
jgi:riboflavin kinase/FMN adenylyltransferase